MCGEVRVCVCLCVCMYVYVYLCVFMCVFVHAPAMEGVCMLVYVYDMVMWFIWDYDNLFVLVEENFRFVVGGVW